MGVSKMTPFCFHVTILHMKDCVVMLILLSKVWQV